MPDSSSAEFARWVHRELLRYYGPPVLKPVLDPLSELIQTIISQRNNDHNTELSYNELRRRFPTWQQALDADTADIADALHASGLSEVKAPRIKAILAQIKQEQGRLSLDALYDMTAEQARNYLLRMYGVGQKTAACVLLFSLGKPAMPVDTHVHRVSLRLGLVPPKTSPDKTQQILEAIVPKRNYYPFHLNVIKHGRTLCTAFRPKCPECPLCSRCAYSHLHEQECRYNEAKPQTK